MKELSSLSNKSTAERCETVLKRKRREIILNLNLISDDSNSFSESSFDELTLPSADSAESPVRLDISKCFIMKRKPSFDHEDSLEEPSRTSTPLPKEEEDEGDDDPPKPDRKVAKKDNISKCFMKRKPSFDHEDSLEEPSRTSTPLPKEEEEDKSEDDPPKPRKVPRKEKKSPSFSCHLCPRSFVYEIFLKKHIEQHKVGFHCKYCGRSFANNDKVSKHEKNVHVARTLYTCDQCSKSFRANASLTAHRALHSATAEKFYCKYCGKNYVLKKSYKRHLQSNPSHDVLNDLKSL